MEGKEVTLELLGTTEQEIAYLAGLFDEKVKAMNRWLSEQLKKGEEG